MTGCPSIRWKRRCRRVLPPWKKARIGGQGIPLVVKLSAAVRYERLKPAAMPPDLRPSNRMVVRIAGLKRCRRRSRHQIGERLFGGIGLGEGGIQLRDLAGLGNGC